MRKVTVCPPCRRQASSAASASRICFRHHASTIALAWDARSHQVQTVHARVQMPSRTRTSVPSDLCTPATVHTHLRSSVTLERSLLVPRTKTKTIGPRGFYFASSAAWNTLPVHLRDPGLSLNNFKIKLKTPLFSWSPPTWGFMFSVFVARANVIIYKLARANILIELNWIELLSCGQPIIIALTENFYKPAFHYSCVLPEADLFISFFRFLDLCYPAEGSGKIPKSYF